MEIEVFFDREIYFSNNFVVLSVSTDNNRAAFIPQNDKYPKKGAYSFKAILKDIYIVDEFRKDKQYILYGDWESDKMGKHFAVNHYREVIGKTKGEIIKHLCSINGIGKSTAKKIYGTFGSEAIEQIEKNPMCLVQVKGLSMKYVKIIKDEFEKRGAFVSFVNFLNKFSIPQKKAKEIFNVYGAGAETILRDNPFIVSDSGLLSFVEANDVALCFNIALDSELRITQGIEYIIEILKTRGDLYFDEKTIISNALKFFNKDSESKINEELIKKFLNKAIADNRLANVGGLICLYKDMIGEKEIAKKLVDFNHCPDNSFVLDSATCLSQISQLENSFGFTLNCEQKNAIVKALASNFSVITGGPGTGKSTLLKFIIEIFKMNFNDNIGLCSPTGKAARRMAECTGINYACTVHSLLNITPDTPFTVDTPVAFPVQYSLLVVDEVSMMDNSLMYMLMRAVPYNSKVVFLGDIDQLPSVGAGAILQDIIDSKVVPTSCLQKIYRQGNNSLIIKNSARLNNGNFRFEKNNSDFIVKVKIDDYENEIVKEIKNLLLKGIKPDEIQVLTPYRSSSFKASSSILNPTLQEIFNPEDKIKRQEKVGLVNFREGDRIIQQKNGPDAKNGDTGVLYEINKGTNGSVNFLIDFGGEKQVVYSRDEMFEYKVDLAYAITVHKSQGSEYPYVIMPIIKQHVGMLSKKLVYTAWTRAKKSVIIIGNIGILQYSVNNFQDKPRKTYLRERLIARENSYRKRDKKEQLKI